MIDLPAHVHLPLTQLILIVAACPEDADKVFEANHPDAEVVQVYRVGNNYYYEVANGK